MDIPKGKYAWSVTVGERGQIVIPKQAREIFDIRGGDTLLLLGDEAQGMAIPCKDSVEAWTTHIFASSGGALPQKEQNHEDI